MFKLKHYKMLFSLYLSFYTVTKSYSVPGLNENGFN